MHGALWLGCCCFCLGYDRAYMGVYRMSGSSGLRSRLGKVRGLGSAHHGTDHWWHQRVTAIALIPLTAWFMVSLISCLLSSDAVTVAEWFASPLNTVLMLFLLPMALYHGKLGFQVVVEDYVKPPMLKYGLLLLNTYACIAMMVFCALAILKLHFLDIIIAGGF